ncbi:MAG: hypothetical protein FWG05_04145, partial [Kiritimatiellaeota bacterium]|nr:hypothetical protein [Kiritimatiellota bacterium]
MKNIIAITLLAGVFCSGNVFAQSAYQMKISFPGYVGDRDVLTNFPALVVFEDDIGGSGFSFAEHRFATDTGYDLRFFGEDNKPLDYEIDTFIENEFLLAWVKVPFIRPTGNSFVRAVWGDPAITAQQDCTTNGAVWADAYLLVQHYNETNGVSVADATAFGRTSTIINPVANSFQTESFIGNAVDLSAHDNSRMEMNAGNNVNLPNNWTISLWYKKLNPSSWRTLVRGSDSNHHIIIKENSTELGVYHDSYSGFNGAKNGDEVAEIFPDADEGEWRHLTAVGTGGKTLFYTNGVYVGTSPVQVLNDVFSLGNYQGGGQKFANYLDEFRIAGSARSADWVRADFMSQNDNTAFTSYAAPEDVIPAIENLPASDIVPGAARFNARFVMNGSYPADIKVLWGPADESATGGWANTNAISGGPWANGSLVFYDASGLAADEEYFYAFVAENAAGAAMAAPSSYFINAPLSFSVETAVFGADVNDVTEVVVSRPASCVGADLTVYYSLSGTADADVNYTATPESGALVIEAGQTDAVITFAPLTPLNFDFAKNVVITLEPGAYVVATPAQNTTLTLAQIACDDYVWNAESGNWSDAWNWSPAGGPPVNGGDTGLINYGAAYADATLGVPGNWPQITVASGGALHVAANPLATPLTFDGGALTTPNNALSGNITLGSGGVNVGAGNCYLYGAISGEGGIDMNSGYIQLGGGYADNAPNTYEGTTVIRSGSIRLWKNNSVKALPGDVVLDGGNLWVDGVAEQINPDADITVLNGRFTVSGNWEQQWASETVSNLFLLGATASAGCGAGSYGGSYITVQNHTVISNTTVNANGKGAWFATRSCEIWGWPGKRSLDTSTWDGNGDCGLSIGAGGMVFHQPDEGVC